MDREGGGMSKSPNVAIEDAITLDLEDGHSGCRGLSEGSEGIGNRHCVCRLLFPIGRLSLSKKSDFCNLPMAKDMKFCLFHTSLLAECHTTPFWHRKDHRNKNKLYRVMLYDPESAITECDFGNVKLTDNDAIPSTGRSDSWPLSIKSIASAKI
jgi:hypothetical protein